MAQKWGKMRKNFKRVLAGAMCVVMLGLTACSSDDGKETKKETEVTDNTGDSNEESSVRSILRDIEYASEVKEAVSFEGSEAVESDIFVAPVEGMTDEFIRGVDISSYVVEKDAGVVFKDFEGNELKDYEFFEFLAECGVNWVRIRVWNHPYNADGQGFGGGNNDIEKAVVMGKLATDAGMNVLIDFHYSDFWADPNKQMVPKEWAHKSLVDLEKLIAEYTTESLNKLKDAGVNVAMVQIGNEINAGMAGETEPERKYTLLKAASAAIREVDKDIKIAVHFANPEKSTFTEYADSLAEAGLDYDVFGISYYPYWHGTLENLEYVMETIQKNHGVETVVMETSYAYTMSDGDGFSNSIGDGATGVEYNYEVSVQGQANAVRDVMNTVCQAGGLGVFYWEPAWIPVEVWTDGATDVYESNKEAWEKYGCGWAASYSVKYDPDDAGVWYGGSSWDNQAMFAFDGTPLESINVWKYVFGGTTAENKLSYVDNIEYQSGIGKAVEMPTTVKGTMVDGSKIDVDVTWNADEIAAAESAGAGDYTINGTATSGDQSFDITCKLSIMKVNYLKNPGFEEADMSMWKINGSGIDREKDNNKRSGDYSLKFWSDQKVSYSVEQTITGLSAGTYELSGFLQGGDAGSGAVFELYITVNGEKFSDGTSVSGWLNWDNPVISNIVIPEGAEVVVGVRAEAAANAWGAWDDLTLYTMD